MTKEELVEQLREGIKTIEEMWYGSPPDGTIAPPHTTFVSHLLVYLASQGLCLEVEGELPDWISSCPSANSETCKTCDNCEIFDFAVFDLTQAGYKLVKELED